MDIVIFRLTEIIVEAIGDRMGGGMPIFSPPENLR